MSTTQRDMVWDEIRSEADDIRDGADMIFDDEDDAPLPAAARKMHEAMADAVRDLASAMERIGSAALTDTDKNREAALASAANYVDGAGAKLQKLCRDIYLRGCK